jgi:hypothetical protein
MLFALAILAPIAEAMMQRQWQRAAIRATMMKTPARLAAAAAKTPARLAAMARALARHRLAAQDSRSTHQSIFAAVPEAPPTNQPMRWARAQRARLVVARAFAAHLIAKSANFATFRRSWANSTAETPVEMRAKFAG